MSLFDMDQILKINIDNIKTNVQLKNIRTVTDGTKIRELADSIYNEGLMTPLVIMDSFDAKDNEILELVAGSRRLKAISLIRNEYDSEFMDDGVPCIQFEGSLHDAVFINAEENIAREEVDEVDIAQWVYDRVEEGVTQTEVSERIHKSLQYVSFRYQFHTRACDELKQAVREGNLAFSSAYELSKNLGSDDQIKFLNKYKALGQKVSLADARIAGTTNRSTKPGKKARDTMLARVTQLSEDGNELAHGMTLALSWVDGLIDNDEMNDVVTNEEGK